MSAKPQWDWSAVPAEMVDHLKTLEQQEVFRLLQGGMTAANVARHRKVADRVNCGVIKNIKLNLRAAGYDPDNGMRMVSPDPQMLKGRSALVKVNEDGTETVAMYWNKTDTKKEDLQEAMRQFVNGLKCEIDQVKPTKPDKARRYNSELLCAIVIGDAHIGAYCYAPETRHSNFDTDIATADIRQAIDNLVARSPEAETGVLINVGDFLHSNTSHNATFKGTPVDVDTRHHRVMRAAAMALRYSINRMLEKYKSVILVVARGNHDPDAAGAIQLMLEFYYEKEPRVNVLRTEGSFHYIEFGKWLFGVNHGDKIKAQKLVNVMARDMSEAWGRTTHRMWFLGHVHHEKTLELDGCKVKTFGTLAPPDGWHSSMGYAADSTMELITFKKSGGTHSQFVYDIPRPIVQPDARIA